MQLEPLHADGNLMQLRSITGRDSVRLVMEGELDIAAAPLLKDALREVDASTRRVILDLRAVTFVDSLGLRALVEAQDACREGGREMAVVRGPAEVENVFSVTGMERHLCLVGHPAEAVAAPAAGEPEPGAHPLARWSSFRSGARAAVSPPPPPAPASRGSRHERA
jgi:anti-sigma B factor antagonist